MIHVVLFEPEIPPNAGNIARTCAATGAALHLIEPLGFSLDDRHLRRAGLDYWPEVDLSVHPTFDTFRDTARPTRLCALSTRGNRFHTEIPVERDTFLLFGPETRGLPEAILEQVNPHVYRIPMRERQRSINLSNAVAVVVYSVLTRGGLDGLV